MRIKYLKYACEEVIQRMIGTVEWMLERRAHEGDECVNVAFMIMSNKKRDSDRLNNFRKGMPVGYVEQNM